MNPKLTSRLEDSLMFASPSLPFPASAPEIARVCCHCRRTQTLFGGWSAEPGPLDQPATHVICPACFEQHYPDLVAEVERFAVRGADSVYNEGDS